jgi:hypothetical protein
MFANEEMHKMIEATYKFPDDSTSIRHESIFPMSSILFNQRE